ncbi:MAG: PhzF family phenazine biosynthesis protein [Streptosporangiaceae bacterium]
MTLALHLCDVFADRPLSGNSLSVVIHDEPLETTFMQALARELRQFETAFLSPTDRPGTFATRVFDLSTELDFAGHPLLGAAAVLHSRPGTGQREEWRLSIHGREVPLVTTRGERPGTYISHMDQGAPAFLATADAGQARRAAGASTCSERSPRTACPVTSPTWKRPWRPTTTRGRPTSSASTASSAAAASRSRSGWRARSARRPS